jgi:hypothetical protein
VPRKSIEEILIGAARGEPLDVAARERLAAALEGAAELRHEQAAQRMLSGELEALRRALAAQTSPTPEAERELRTKFRALAGRRAGDPARRPSRQRASAVGLAAVLLVVTVSVLAIPWLLRSGAEPESETVIAAQAAAPFWTLPGARSEAGSASYSVVRIRVPLSSLALVDFSGGSTIEAEVLLGEDGLVHGIRFDPSPALVGDAAAPGDQPRSIDEEQSDDD